MSIVQVMVVCSSPKQKPCPNRIKTLSPRHSGIDRIHGVAGRVYGGLKVLTTLANESSLWLDAKHSGITMSRLVKVTILMSNAQKLRSHPSCRQNHQYCLEIN